MLKKYSIYIGFFLYSILQSFLIFLKIPEDKFLFIGDQFIRFSLDETTRNAFYIRKMENFGVFNAWQLTVQTPDILYYTIVYRFGLDIRSAEMLLFALIIFITLTVSYIGFNRLHNLFYSQKNLWIVIAVTIWYSMNPYLMVMWHGAIYNLGSSITYALAPLILYFFHISLTDIKATRERIICALLMFLASFTFWMFAAICFFLILYTVFYLAINRHIIFTAVFNGAKLLAFYIPMCAIIIFPILHEYFNNQGDVNGTFYATFGQIKGGLLYQLMMYFSWGIYNVWTPRSIYPPEITSFYFSPFYIISTLGLYALLIWAIILTLKTHTGEKLSAVLRKNYYTLIFLGIFLISIFLAKGKEPPFGGIFLFLYNNMPFFSVFRSSDHRFGFPAVLAMCILFLILLSKLKRTKLIVGSIIAITILQNFVFFSGSLITGQNKDDQYYDRIVEIPEEYRELSDFLEADTETSYIFPYPSTEFGLYRLEEGEVHIGQDVLPKILSTNFAYIPVTSGMHIATAQRLVSGIVNASLDELRLLPIKYILVRHDTSCEECPDLSEESLTAVSSKVFSNSLFDLYQLDNHTPIVNSNSQITFRRTNPTRFDIHLENVGESSLINLMQSYNNNWNLYIEPYTRLCDDPIQINSSSFECTADLEPIDFRDMFVSSKVENSRVTLDNLGHMNSWAISPTRLASNFGQNYYQENEDGTYNFRLTVFYTPQSTYLRMIAITFISILSALGFMGYWWYKSIRKKHSQQ